MRKFAPDANGYEKRLERLGSSRFSLSISAVEITDTTAPGAGLHGRSTAYLASAFTRLASFDLRFAAWLR